jgi:hypothetical protein
MMLEFHKVTLDDIEKLRPLILQGDSKICNNTVGGIFMWRDYFNMECALWDDTVILKACANYHGVSTVFSIPLGGCPQGGLDRIAEYCREINIPLAFYAITVDDFDLLRTKFNDFTTETNENWSDYIYEASALTKLEGRKYSGKRNHINQFKREHPGWVFEKINEENLPLVQSFYEKLSSEQEFTTHTSIEDHDKTVEVLDNYSVYGLLGGLLRVDNEIVAFSIGETKGEVLHVHIEKANTIYKGVYQVLNNEFAKLYATENIKCINREEDDGDPGLRFSKKSYYPFMIIEKYIVVIK